MNDSFEVLSSGDMSGADMTSCHEGSMHLFQHLHAVITNYKMLFVLKRLTKFTFESWKFIQALEKLLRLGLLEIDFTLFKDK